MNHSVTSLSVFFPCYNDKGTIERLVHDAIETIQTLGIGDYEVIVVDDGSTDGARELLRELVKTIPRLRVVFHEKNCGYGSALKSGFAAVRKEWVFYTDGDAQYDVRELALLAANALGADVVNGYKIRRNDSLTRIIIGALYQWGIRLGFLLKIRDVDCDFRLIRKQKLNAITLTSNGGSICVELTRRLQNIGAVFKEVPVHHYNRVYGSSQFFTLRRVGTTLLTLIVLWFRLVLLRQTK